MTPASNMAQNLNGRPPLQIRSCAQFLYCNPITDVGPPTQLTVLVAPFPTTTTKQPTAWQRRSTIRAERVSGRGCPSGSAHRVGSVCPKPANNSKDEEGGNREENQSR